MAADVGFFDGLQAKDILSYGLEAYKSNESISKNNADKAAADAQAKAYDLQQQKTTQTTVTSIDKKTLYWIGGGATGLLLLGVALKKWG